MIKKMLIHSIIFDFKEIWFSASACVWPLTLLGSKIQLVFLPTDCHTAPRKLDMTFSVSSTQHPLADNLISSCNLFARKILELQGTVAF